MAGIKLIFNSRVKASTILEVLISMIFIIVIFGIAMMIYTNVIRQSLSVQQLHAQAILKSVLADSEKQPSLTNQVIKIDSIQVEQTIRLIGPDSGLVSVHLKAYDNNNKLLAELNKVILKKDE